MPRDVRVGDTVTFKRPDGETITAEITAVTNQNLIDIRYPHHDDGALFTAAAGVARASTNPPAVNTWWKNA